MTTEPTTTNHLPPCPLPCGGGEHHFHDVEAYAAEKDKAHDCATRARDGFRCYGPHRPGLSEPIDLPEITDEIAAAARTAWGLKTSWDSTEDITRPPWRAAAVAVRDVLLASIPQWQPIEHDQIRAGMRIRATIQCGDRTTIHVGAAHHQAVGCWYTEDDGLLTGWSGPITYEVDPAPIPDPDAELIEAIGKAIHDADWGCDDEWGKDGTEDAYRKLARAALAAIHESEATA